MFILVAVRACMRGCVFVCSCALFVPRRPQEVCTVSVIDFATATAGATSAEEIKDMEAFMVAVRGSPPSPVCLCFCVPVLCVCVCMW